jgi:hypothetical protein
VSAKDFECTAPGGARVGDLVELARVRVERELIENAGAAFACLGVALLDSEKARVPFAKRRVNAVLPDSSMMLRPRSVAAIERTSANFLQSSKNNRAHISSLEEIQVSSRASSAARVRTVR